MCPSADSRTVAATIVGSRSAPEGHTLYDIEVLTAAADAAHSQSSTKLISRRYCNFDALDRALGSTCAGLGVTLPRLPPKSVLRQNLVCTAEAFQEDRQCRLQRYLSNLLLLREDLGSAYRFVELFLQEEQTSQKSLECFAAARVLHTLDANDSIELSGGSRRRRGKAAGALFSFELPRALLLPEQEDVTSLSDFRRSAAAGAVSLLKMQDGESLRTISSEVSLLAAFTPCAAESESEDDCAAVSPPRSGLDHTDDDLLRLCLRFCSVNFWMVIFEEYFKWDMFRKTRILDRHHVFLLSAGAEEFQAGCVLLVQSEGIVHVVTFAVMSPMSVCELRRSASKWSTSHLDVRVDVRPETYYAQSLPLGGQRAEELVTALLREP
mmetsp:Transcript_28716/g.66646  ORF Transcript_28716/g.66646 Transcript_28716/m.66646 type:complete len:381 (-) Transcript_28716:147-1289(-)